MSRRYLLLIRYLNSPQFKIFFFIVFSLIIFGYQNITFCEEPFSVSEVTLNLIKEDAYVNVKNIIRRADFIDTFGTRKSRPGFVTWYYTHMICSEDYIQEFLRGLPLKEIWYNHRDNAEDIQLHIAELFGEYAQRKLYDFEHRIIKYIRVFFLVNDIVLTKEIGSTCNNIREKLQNEDFLISIEGMKHLLEARNASKIIFFAIGMALIACKLVKPIIT